MYFFGFSKECSERKIDMNSERQWAESCVEIHKPVKMVTLFGRQVYLMQSDEKSHINPNREIDLHVHVDSRIYDLNMSPEHNSAEFESLSSIPQIQTEPPTSVSCNVRNLEPFLSLPSGLIISEIPKPCFKGNAEPSFISRGPRLLDLNEIPADDEAWSDHDRTIDEPTPFSSPCSRNVNDKDSNSSSPASYASCLTTEHLSGTQTPAAPPSCRTRLEYSEKEAKPANAIGGFCQKDDSSVMGSFIQIAAESLIHISCNDSSKDRDFGSKPEFSCDSYELLTMEITETTPEEYCVSSKARDEVSIRGDQSKELGCKLRRGRRMKNFQKEILPGIAALSSHEIREDIDILEAVLRSREYKKLQLGKTGDDDTCGERNPTMRNKSSMKRFGKRRRRRRC